MTKPGSLPTGSESTTQGVCEPLQESGRTEVRPYMGQSGGSKECPLRLAPPIYRCKFRGGYRKMPA